jgi:rhodanese-related sulfurtransferase
MQGRIATAEDSDWNTDIDGALKLPLSQLAGRLAKLPENRLLFVCCASGYRSAIATSLLRRDGLPCVANLVGGLGAGTPRSSQPSPRVTPRGISQSRAS